MQIRLEKSAPAEKNSETHDSLAGKGKEAMMEGGSCREGEEECEERGSETPGGLSGKEREIVEGMSSETPDGLAGKRRESVKEWVKKHPIVYQGRLGRV